MNLQEFNAKALQRACLGNVEALSFLDKWRQYIHCIDDIEDTKTTSEFRLFTFILAMEVYNHPFYLRNAAPLKQIVLNCTNAYADCVAWEKSGEPWQREFADHYRHFGIEMVLAVAGILGGYTHMRAISQELRAACHVGHHDKKGRPQ
jgi:hypothetical protein